MVKAYVVNGLGIGCHEEVAHAFKQAGAEAEIVHIKQILSGEKDLSKAQILNFSGGFLHGDILGAGMSAANELEHSGIKDRLLEFADKGNVIYGQCNGFQLLVKTGLLPGIDGDYSKQKVTLTHNDAGNYFVGFVRHAVEKEDHFAFQDIGFVDLWCRHGEGKIQFYSEHGLISKEDGEKNRAAVNANHVLLRYVDLDNQETTLNFPENPNGSVDGIAGLVNENGNIFGHMAHPEVSVYASRNPGYFNRLDALRRTPGMTLDYDTFHNHDVGLMVFSNIVNHLK